MTRPACVPAREPLSDTLPPLARLRLKLLTGTLPVIAGFLYAAVIRSLNSLLTVSELPNRLARCISEAGTSRVRALGCTGVYGSAAVRSSIACRVAVPEPGKKRCVSRTPRPRSQGFLACARVGVYGLYGFSTAPSPACAGHLCTTHQCEAWNRAFFAQCSCFPRRRLTHRHP